MAISENKRETLITIVKNALSHVLNQEDGMLAVYLFGSLVKGDFKVSSDIDLAFVMDKTSCTDNSLMAFSRTQKISQALGQIVQRPVDGYLLNESSLFFAFDVINTGTCLYVKDQSKKNHYERSLKGRYYDVKPLFKNLRQQKMVTA